MKHAVVGGEQHDVRHLFRLEEVEEGPVGGAHGVAVVSRGHHRGGRVRRVLQLPSAALEVEVAEAGGGHTAGEVDEVLNVVLIDRAALIEIVRRGGQGARAVDTGVEHEVQHRGGGRQAGHFGVEAEATLRRITRHVRREVVFIEVDVALLKAVHVVVVELTRIRDAGVEQPTAVPDRAEVVVVGRTAVVEDVAVGGAARVGVHLEGEDVTFGERTVARELVVGVQEVRAVVGDDRVRTRVDARHQVGDHREHGRERVLLGGGIAVDAIPVGVVGGALVEGVGDLVAGAAGGVEAHGDRAGDQALVAGQGAVVVGVDVGDNVVVAALHVGHTGGRGVAGRVAVHVGERNSRTRAGVGVVVVHGAPGGEHHHVDI